MIGHRIWGRQLPNGPSGVDTNRAKYWCALGWGQAPAPYSSPTYPRRLDSACFTGGLLWPIRKTRMVGVAFRRTRVTNKDAAEMGQGDRVEWIEGVRQ